MIEDISNLEVAYAPPFASAMDVVNAVANVAEKRYRGQRMVPITAPRVYETVENREETMLFLY